MQQWRPVKRDVAGGNHTVLPPAVVANLEHRDIRDEDYDLLLQLDQQK